MKENQKPLNSEQKWIPDGFHFLGPEESKNRRILLQKVSEVFESYGYSEITLPSFDYTASFRSHLSDRENELLVAKDWDGNELSPSVDLTIQVVKGMAARSHWEENQNVYYTAKKIRDHKKRNASRREVLQIGAETIGNSSNKILLSQCEVLHKIWALLQPEKSYTIVFGNTDFVQNLLSPFSLSSLQNSYLRQLLYTKNKPELISWAKLSGFSALFLDIALYLCDPIPLEELEAFASKVFSHKDHTVSKELISLWDSIGSFFGEFRLKFPNQTVIWDPSLQRDLSYYTGFLFQGFIADSPEPVFGGGVYNHLYEQFTGFPKDACGFALHLDPLENYREGGVYAS